MNVVYKTPQQLASVLIPIFEEYKINKAVLFGSYAKGSATSDSDVDLLVDSGLRGLKFVGLIQSISDALKLPIDLFDVSHIETNSPIRDEIESTGVVIYEK